MDHKESILDQGEEYLDIQIEKLLLDIVEVLLMWLEIDMGMLLEEEEVFGYRKKI